MFSEIFRLFCFSTAIHVALPIISQSHAIKITSLHLLAKFAFRSGTIRLMEENKPISEIPNEQKYFSVYSLSQTGLFFETTLCNYLAIPNHCSSMF